MPRGSRGRCRVLTKHPSISTSYGASGERLRSAPAYRETFLWTRISFSLYRSGFAGGSIAMSVIAWGFSGTASRCARSIRLRADRSAAGVRYESWTVNVFATNVAESARRADGGLDAIKSGRVHYIQPRTIGLSLIEFFSSRYEKKSPDARCVVLNTRFSERADVHISRPAFLSHSLNGRRAAVSRAVRRRPGRTVIAFIVADWPRGYGNSSLANAKTMTRQRAIGDIPRHRGAAGAEGSPGGVIHFGGALGCSWRVTIPASPPWFVAAFRRCGSPCRTC